MKTRMAVMTSIACLLMTTGCKDDREIPYHKLPAKAQNFIETFFPDQSDIYAERERNDGHKEFEVRLSGGIEIEFDHNGEWKSVDCSFSTVPEGIVPQKIADDIAVRYPGVGIYKAERKPGGYQISTGNGLELFYSADGVFVRAERD